jgi:hypothetical protein
VKLRILRGSPVAAAALAAGLLAAAAPAQAWNADTHEAIARAAFLISPDAASRVPADQLAAFFRELREPDPFDRMCERHRGPGARLDAAAEAEKAYRELGSSDASPYNRARLIARYLHYAADCAEPAAIAEGRRLPDFFANKNLVVFRQARPLAVPIAAALRDSSKRASWADDTPGAYSEVFRQAVNLSLDALLGLPGPREAASGEPVIFVVNRLDSGFGAVDERKVTVYHEVTINQQKMYVGLDATLKQGGGRIRHSRHHEASGSPRRGMDAPRCRRERDGDGAPLQPPGILRVGSRLEIGRLVDVGAGRDPARKCGSRRSASAFARRARERQGDMGLGCMHVEGEKRKCLRCPQRARGRGRRSLRAAIRFGETPGSREEIWPGH